MTTADHNDGSYYNEEEVKEEEEHDEFSGQVENSYYGS